MAMVMWVAGWQQPISSFPAKSVGGCLNEPGELPQWLAIMTSP